MTTVNFDAFDDSSGKRMADVFEKRFIFLGNQNMLLNAFFSLLYGFVTSGENLIL